MLLRTVKLLLIFSPLFLSVTAYAFKKMTREEYINTYKDDAIRDMQKTGVPASITIAQAVLESQDGNSPLAREANNHFGIKCTGDWTGGSYIQDDDKKDECFRKYNSVLESYDDHSYFLKTRNRYAFLFQLDPTDYEGWAKGLKKAGYATNPHYATRLIKIIEDHQLYKLDREQPGALTASAGANTPYISREVKESSRPLYKPSRSSGRTHENGTVDPFNKSRAVKTNNGVPYVIAKRGDTYDKIAKQQEMMGWLIYKYNDVEKNAKVQEGQAVYIKPKLRKGAQDYYTVKEGDTMQSISQELGIKVKMLYKRNHLEKGTEPPVGTRLWINSKKPS